MVAQNIRSVFRQCSPATASRHFVANQNNSVAGFLCGWFVVRKCIADISGRELCCVVFTCVSFFYFYLFIWVNRNTFYIIKLLSQVTLS